MEKKGSNEMGNATVTTRDSKKFEASLPKPIIEVMDREGLKIELQKIGKNMIIDQGSGMVASDGCISNPGGPSC